MAENAIPEPIDLNAHRTRRTGEDEFPSYRAIERTATTPDTAADGVTDAGADTLPARRPAAPTSPTEREVLVGEIVDLPDVSGEPAWRGDAHVRPILPAWLSSRDNFVTAVSWVWSYAWRTTAFHAIRIPFYGGKLALQSPRGLWRVAGRARWWVFDGEGAPVRAEVSTHHPDPDKYVKLTHLRNDRVRLRLVVAGAAIVTALIGVGFLFAAPELYRWLALAVAVAALGVVGKAADKPLIGKAVVTSGVPKLDSDSIVRALISLGVPGINQGIARGESINFPSPIREDGPGWRADIDLPSGVTAGEVMDKRDKLASGLRRPLGCVWPEGDEEEHTGRLVLWVGRRDLSKTKQPTWPLLKAGQVDLFSAVPIGTDQRGRWVTVVMMFASMAIGAIPRMGKTFALRLLLLLAALDVRAELHVYDLKGTGDLSPLEHVAHRYRVGDDEEDIEYAVTAMRELKKEMRRRSKVIRNLSKEECPESKITPDLASRKSLGLHPIVCGIDECQIWFEHPDHGKELEEICTDLTKRGPAVGIHMWFSTQRPDAKSLPSGISANVSTRFCLKVMDHTANDMVLGTGAHKRGVRATTFSWNDKGIGYLIAGADPQITRTVYLDGKAAEKVGLRARALRLAAGRLTGHAAGQELEIDTANTVSLLQDVLTAIPAGQDKAWSEVVCERLAARRPDLYGSWGPDQLAAALKPLGISTVQIGRRIDGKTVNRRGIDRTHLLDAVAQRDEKRSTD